MHSNTQLQYSEYTKSFMTGLNFEMFFKCICVDHKRMKEPEVACSRFSGCATIDFSKELQYPNFWAKRIKLGSMLLKITESFLNNTW